FYFIFLSYLLSSLFPYTTLFRSFIIYSASQSWLPSYKLGQLRLPGDDPMKPENWEKEGPVFEGTEEVHGVGHASFTTSPDGTERSEEHTSELQSRFDLVCRLLLE